MMNIAARYLRHTTGVKDDLESPDIPAELKDRLQGHKVVAYPSPCRGRTTQAPDSSSPRPRSLSESRKSQRSKDLVKDVYDRMGIAYSRETGADLSSDRQGRSRSRIGKDESPPRTRPRSLSRGRIASIWPPPSRQNNIDSAWSFSPKSTPLSPTKKTMHLTTAMAFQETKPTSNNHPSFGSPAYCKDMLSLMPHPTQGEPAEGSISPKSSSTCTQKTEGSSETDAETSSDGNDSQPKPLSVKDRINSLGGSVKEATKKTRNVSPRKIDPKYAAKLALGVGLAPKVDIFGSPKNDHQKSKTEATLLLDERKEDGYRAKSYLQRNPTASAPMTETANKELAKQKMSATSAFRNPGHVGHESTHQLPALALSTSSSDFDLVSRRPLWPDRKQVNDPAVMMTAYDNEDIDRLIDERVQAHVAVLEAKMESQLGRFMEQMNRKFEQLQGQLNQQQQLSKPVSFIKK